MNEQRHNVTIGMDSVSKDGNVVLYTDYAKLEAELVQEKERSKKLAEALVRLQQEGDESEAKDHAFALRAIGPARREP